MVERIIVGPLFTNSYIYFIGKKQCAVVDPGGDAPRLLQHLNQLNKIPLYIIFTHGHLDHISGTIALLSHYSHQKVLTVAHSKELPYFGKGAEEHHRRSFRTLGPEGEALFLEVFEGVPEIDLTVEDGEMIPETDLKVLHTPGHSPGSICLYSETKGLLFSGDTLFFEGVGRTDLEGGDGQVLFKSIKEKILTLPPTTRIFPGHGPHTTLERELRNNPFVANIRHAYSQ